MQKKKILTKNLNIIKKLNYEYYRFLEDMLTEIDFGKFDAVDTRDNNKSVSYYDGKLKRYLCSRISPLKTAERIIKSSGIEPDSEILLVDFGCGHIPEYLYKIGYNNTLYIMEFNYDLFLFTLSLKDFEKILGNLKIIFLYGRNEEEMKNIFQVNLKGSGDNIKLVLDKSVMEIIPDKYKSFYHIIRTVTINRNFSIKLKDMQEINIRKNRDFILNSYPVKILFDRFNEFPGLLVASGPSIDHYIPIIKSVSGRLIITALDSSTSALMRNGIKPDFIISIDPQKKCADYLTGYYDSRMNYIFTPYSYHGVVDKTSGNKFLMVPYKHPALDKIYKKIENKGIVKNCGSVASYALYLLIKMGCKTIYLCGTDFGMVNGLYFAKSTGEYTRMSDSIYKFKTIETSHFEEFYGNTIEEDGEFHSMYNLNSYYNEFDKFISANKHLNFFNLKHKGRELNNTLNVTGFDNISEYKKDKRSILKKIEEDLPGYSPFPDKDLKEIFDNM